MRLSDIRLYYDFNNWANRHILAHVSQITAEQLTRPAPFPSGSLYGTLLHTLGAEWVWLRRWQGEMPTGMPADLQSLTTVEALAERWQQQEQELDRFLESIQDGDLDHELFYRTFGGVEDTRPLWQLMLHVVNHGTQHRAEAAAMLTDYGHSPGDIDFTIYLRQRATEPTTDR